MLVKVQYQGVKKFVKLHSDSTFQDFLTEVKSKFALARTAALEVFDTDTTVEEDIFHELIEGSPHLCLTVRCPEENISAGLSEEFSPTRSSTPSTCTDTLSLSSTDHEETERAMQNQAAMASNSFNMDAEKAKQIVQDALEKKSGGEEVLEEYQKTKTLKHSTRRQLVNIAVSHMTEIHGRIPTRKQRETYALGIIYLFPSLRDPFSTKGYINQDFALLFNAETSNKFLERWETAFKQKIIDEAQCLTSTAEIWCLLNAAGVQGSDNGRKKTKISPTEAVDRLVHFHKSCTSIEGRLSRREGHQPFLLRSGRIKGRINHFYVVVDKRLIPCVGTSSLSAFDELFKVHYVFNLSYEKALVSKANSLFYRPFDLQCLYGSDDGEYMVPFFVLV
ncbi:uncharacterized protein LOC107714409 [Sinocyclocheilus rhinocerous]|uniref:uncharacterized protein LOC107714409 n=1 Tax=Sinocyclocheilus rhinocerous TaxID=307959 RepID=UPI0007BA1B0B|nr:PREDICTED: uncharacterized protein LOC107714409 [Sinocyclocheilus rhinocerous]